MKNYTPLFTILISMLIFLRIISNESENLVYIISILNFIALLIVFFSIAEKIKTTIHEKIAASKVPKDIIEREIKTAYRKINIITYVPISIIIVIYFGYLASELGNDIISIISLGLSLVSSNIVEIVVKKLKL